jgi:hypothetical protein
MNTDTAIYLFLIFCPVVIIGLGYFVAKDLSQEEIKEIESNKRLESYVESNVDYDKLFEERNQNGYYDVNTSDM